MIKKVVEKLPSYDPPIEITYYLYLGSKRMTDISNVCSIVDKYFCDVLVQEGKIPDDNYNHLVKVSYIFAGIDTKNPRVEVQINSNPRKKKLQKTKSDMQISLNQTEIEQAIKEFVRKQVTISDTQKLDIELRAGRGDNGYTATLEVTPIDSKVPVTRLNPDHSIKNPIPDPITYTDNHLKENEDESSNVEEEEIKEERSTSIPSRSSIFNR